MLTAEMAYNNSTGLELDEGLAPTLGQWLQTFELTSGDGYGVIGNVKLIPVGIHNSTIHNALPVLTHHHLFVQPVDVKGTH